MWCLSFFSSPGQSFCRSVTVGGPHRFPMPACRNLPSRPTTPPRHLLRPPGLVRHVCVVFLPPSLAFNLVGYSIPDVAPSLASALCSAPTLLKFLPPVPFSCFTFNLHSQSSALGLTFLCIQTSLTMTLAFSFSSMYLFL